MRISTSEIFEQQTLSIDNLTAQESQQAAELSSGKSLNVPSDDPSQIAEDLAVRTNITVQNQVGDNLSNVQDQLTTVDSTLSNVTSVLQSARSLAVEAASDTVSASQMQNIATQVQQLLQESVGYANTQYAGQYVFGGTAATSALPVTLNNAPATTGPGYDGVVQFTGNNVAQSQTLPDGTSVQTSVTMQQAFNLDAADGSPDVFQVLQNLYSTLENQASVDESATSLNVPGTAITANTTFASLAGTGAGALLQTPLTYDNSTVVPPTVPPTQQVSINIAGGSSGSGVNLTFTSNESVGAMIAQINGATAQTGVTASFNYQTQRLSLSGTGTFSVTDVPSPGATDSGNFTTAFGLQNTGDVVNNLSTQLGDIDNVTNALLEARTQVGAATQQVQALSSTSATTVTNDTAVQSGIEDTDIASVTTQYTQTQTALEAAYATTSKLEQTDLFDYLTS